MRPSHAHRPIAERLDHALRMATWHPANRNDARDAWRAAVAEATPADLLDRVTVGLDAVDINGAPVTMEVPYAVAPLFHGWTNGWEDVLAAGHHPWPMTGLGWTGKAHEAARAATTWRGRFGAAIMAASCGLDHVRHQAPFPRRGGTPEDHAWATGIVAAGAEEPWAMRAMAALAAGCPVARPDALRDAVVDGSIAGVHAALKAGADPMAAGTDGASPWSMAIRMPDVDRHGDIDDAPRAMARAMTMAPAADPVAMVLAHADGPIGERRAVVAAFAGRRADDGDARAGARVLARRLAGSRMTAADEADLRRGLPALRRHAAHPAVAAMVPDP